VFAVLAESIDSNVMTELPVTSFPGAPAATIDPLLLERATAKPRPSPVDSYNTTTGSCDTNSKVHSVARKDNTHAPLITRSNVAAQLCPRLILQTKDFDNASSITNSKDHSVARKGNIPAKMAIRYFSINFTALLRRT
jgi:hypothetical protein